MKFSLKKINFVEDALLAIIFFGEPVLQLCLFYFHFDLLQDEQINVQNEEENILGSTWVDTLSEEDLVKLRPLLFVELSAVFDKAANPFPKIKPHKRKRKQGTWSTKISKYVQCMQKYRTELGDKS